jgi:hypothetical protein
VIIFVLVTENSPVVAAGNSTAVGFGVGEAGLEEEEAKRLRVTSSSTLYLQQLAGVLDAPGP